jgi:hypothetical protein
VFLVAGSVAMIATLVAGSPVGLAVAVACWSLTAFAGYRIWRQRHPGDSAKAAIGIRVRWVLWLIATVVGVSFVQAFPELTLLIVAGYLLLLLGFATLASWAESSVPRETPVRSGTRPTATATSIEHPYDSGEGEGM